VRTAASSNSAFSRPDELAFHASTTAPSIPSNSCGSVPPGSSPRATARVTDDGGDLGVVFLREQPRPGLPLHAVPEVYPASKGLGEISLERARVGQRHVVHDPAHPLDGRRHQQRFAGPAPVDQTSSRTSSRVLGRTFPTPFASPPFRGQSSPPVNVLYGLCNLAVAYALLVHVGDFEARSALHAGAFGLGLSAWSLMLTRSLARLQGGQV
jgi:hypothetical protein